MSKLAASPGQLVLDFTAPPRLAPIPPRILSPGELRAQTERNRKAMEAKLRDLSSAQKRALRVRNLDYTEYGWRIAGVLQAIPAFDRIGGWMRQPDWYEQCDIMRELNLPHGSIMYLRCHHTCSSVLITDRTAVGRYQDLPPV